MEEATFECDLIHSIMKRVWTLRALERENGVANDAFDSEVGAGTSRKIRPTSANASALKLTCELLRVFITEAVQRAAAIAEAEGVSQIEATHLETRLMKRQQWRRDDFLVLYLYIIIREIRECFLGPIPNQSAS